MLRWYLLLIIFIKLKGKGVKIGPLKVGAHCRVPRRVKEEICLRNHRIKKRFPLFFQKKIKHKGKRGYLTFHKYTHDNSLALYSRFLNFLLYVYFAYNKKQLRYYWTWSSLFNGQKSGGAWPHLASAGIDHFEFPRFVGIAELVRKRTWKQCNFAEFNREKNEIIYCDSFIHNQIQ